MSINGWKIDGDDDRSKKWVVNCRREDLVKYDAEKLHTNIRLCSAHFEEEMFANALKKG